MGVGKKLGTGLHFKKNEWLWGFCYIQDFRNIFLVSDKVFGFTHKWQRKFSPMFVVTECRGPLSTLIIS